MFRTVGRHIVWLTIVLGTGFFIYENWRITHSRLELVTLVLIGILFSRMSIAASRAAGLGVGITSIALACLVSPFVGLFWGTALGHFHQPLSQRRQWGFLFICAVANLGLRSKAQRPRTAEQKRPLNRDSKDDLLVRVEELNTRISAASVAQNWPEARRYINELKMVIQALAAIGGPDAAKVIGDALADSAEGFEHRKFEETEQLREAAITALASLGSDVMPIIERGMRDSRSAVRIAFSRALEEIRRGSESHNSGGG